MKKTRVISLLLSLALVCSLLIPGTVAYADGESGSGSTDNGMVISKTATANTDGTYTIQLEAYATGSKIISDVKKDVPTDIVLVLDQSGSMDDPIGTVSFTAYNQKQSTNNHHYNRRHNGGSGNLYYPLSDGSYAAVSVTKQEALDYKPLSTNLVNYKTHWGSLTTDCYYYYANNLYEKVGDEYKQVTLTETSGGSFWNPTYTYTYTFSDRTSVISTGRDSTPTLGSHGPLYYSTVDTIYTYSYTDVDGIVQTIDTSTGDNTQFSTTLYQRTVNENAGNKRLAALQTAVTNFASAVATKAAGADGDITTTNDNVNHRIAVVGYASRADSNNPWINTEVFIGANQYNYNVNASRYYGSAFQNMDTTQGRANVAASIGALDANGATYTNYGLEMANGILNANPVETGKKRNRVIILFTDGYPGKNADDFNETAANSALNQAGIAKDNGVSVYSVGIFSGADATSAGNKDGNNTQAANWFMQQVSSNNGTPQTPSYYLSASDADTLNSIFKQIGEQIESGGSSTTLDESAVVKDIIAPAFALPTGTNASHITLETYSYTGENKWTKNSNALGASATVNGDQVSVTGFDFAENYVGTVTEGGNVSYRGNKLVISFTVTPKAGFLGGNNVYTNTSAAVYENANAAEPVVTFPRPQVNVPIKEVTVTAEDMNVYLLDDLTAEQIKSGATVKCGNVELNLSASNYGLENWQTEYVDITVEIKDKVGDVLTDLTDLKDDTTYTVSVTVAPKSAALSASSGPEATEKSGDAVGKINVFKPELTFQDSEVYYGDTAPADFSENKTSEVWKHGVTLSTDNGVTMIGTAPTLVVSYTPENGKIVGGKINTKQDIAVDTTVNIGSTNVTTNTTFQHTNCTDKQCGTPASGKFWLHVKTCQLTITKQGGASGEPYVFTVKKYGTAYSEVTVVGNGSVTIYELPVGIYTIEEDTGWSWRYPSPTYSGNSATLDKDQTSNTITCTNSNSKNYWLNGYSDVVTNTYESKN